TRRLRDTARYSPPRRRLSKSRTPAGSSRRAPRPRLPRPCARLCRGGCGPAGPARGCGSAGRSLGTPFPQRLHHKLRIDAGLLAQRLPDAPLRPAGLLCRPGDVLIRRAVNQARRFLPVRRELPPRRLGPCLAVAPLVGKAPVNLPLQVPALAERGVQDAVVQAHAASSSPRIPSCISNSSTSLPNSAWNGRLPSASDGP